MIYETHRGWYSFVISTLTSFVYMFGFVSPHRFRFGLPDINGFSQAQLIPQLIINYKLKVCLVYMWTTPCPYLIFLQSVAHMPMKAMIYKTLSTVVDDLFA